MTIIDDIQQKLSAALTPEKMIVRDDSAAHYGHDGASPGNVSHVSIQLVSDKFEGQNRVARQRMVYQAMAEEMPKIHAITQMITLTPAEFAKQ
jgi:BolA protein